MFVNTFLKIFVLTYTIRDIKMFSRSVKTMNIRIKQIRKDSGLSQTDFGKRIGMTRDNIANIEGNRAEIKDVVIKAICREYNVNEEWLRTGKGEMYNLPTDDVADVVSELIEETNPLYDMVVSILKTYNSLDAKSKHVINEFVSEMYRNSKRDGD